jgi:outer membrane lipoprotein carrier protein
VRFFLFSTLIAASIFAAPININSFNSHFEQSIIDDNGKTIRYSGELWAAKPQSALWVYQKPIQKSVYVNAQKVTVIEPQIEQVTLRTLDNEIDFLQIIQKAKRLDDEHYAATIKGQTYNILFKNDTLNTISYTDGYDNRVTIKFLSPVQNKAIEASRFKPTIPQSFDVIKD